jgi:hypothetical protein
MDGFYNKLNKRGRAEGGQKEKQRTTSKYFSIGGEETEEAHYSAMSKVSEGGCVAMWREWKGGEREGQEQKLWALP